MFECVCDTADHDENFLAEFPSNMLGQLYKMMAVKNRQVNQKTKLNCVTYVRVSVCVNVCHGVCVCLGVFHLQAFINIMIIL